LIVENQLCSNAGFIRCSDMHVLDQAHGLEFVRLGCFITG